MGDGQLLCSEDLYRFSLERFHKVADYLDIDQGIREKLAVVKREMLKRYRQESSPRRPTDRPPRRPMISSIKGGSS